MSSEISVRKRGTTTLTIDKPEGKVELALPTGRRTQLTVTGGPRGPTGISGAQPEFNAVAGEDIGGHRAVFIADDGKAYYADPSTAGATPPVGISKNAAAVDALVTVQTGNDLTESSWAWEPGPVYLAADGTLSQTVPTSGAIFLIGVAAGATRLRVTPQLIALI